MDLAKSAVFWGLASKGGNIAAFNNLGHLTYYGRGIKQDFAEGVRLWRIAAEKGFTESQIHIANAYSDGKFLKPDYVEAYVWAKTGLHNAAREEYAETAKVLQKMAVETIAAIQDKLTAVQRTEADKKVKIYILRYASNPE